MKIKAIVLAGGMGKRLGSAEHGLPKAMHAAAGRPLLWHVLAGMDFIPREDVVIVTGYMREAVEDYFQGYRFAWQAEQLGTGHAAKCAAPYFEGYDGPVLVAYGDMPLLTGRTYRGIAEEHAASGSDCTFLTCVTDKPFAYGRIVRGADGAFERVVEDKDCTPAQKAIREMNVGLYVFDSRKLFEALGRVKNANAQGEFYLTDVPDLLRREGGRVGTYTIADDREIAGVSTVEDLALCGRILEERARSGT